jgi:hypothetical protein
MHFYTYLLSSIENRGGGGGRKEGGRATKKKKKGAYSPNTKDVDASSRFLFAWGGGLL